jgi:predicted ATPase/DNA-binding SARP family transcriptional activator
MKFGLLGPVVANVEGTEPVAPPEATVRSLLAILALAGGDVVTDERLIDGLWGAALPSDPRAVLQNRVWKLRRWFRGLGDTPDVVQRVGGGYRLGCDPGDVDAIAFERALQGALDGGAGRVSDQLRSLESALGLWRADEPLLGLGGEPFVQPAAVRLVQMRLQAVEMRGTLLLEEGDAPAAELDALEVLGREPLRESAMALLLRARAMDGRNAAALQAYADVARRLREELGVDPSPQLQALHRALLDGRLEQPPARPPATGSAPRRPAPPPAVAGELVGRDGAVRELLALVGTSRLVTLVGPGGVGKTRLAAEVAQEVDRTRPVAWVDLAALSPSAESSAVIDSVATAVGLRLDGAGGEMTELDRLTAHLEQRSMLLVLDNAEHLAPTVGELVASLLAGRSVDVLVTSRESLGLAQEWRWDVRPLAVPEPLAAANPAALRSAGAVELFLRRAQAAAGFEPRPGDVDAVVAICRALDGLPLAIELAAARTRSLGVHELATRLDDRLQLLGDERRRDVPERQRTLRGVLDWSWELLTEAERLVLRRLAVAAGGAGLDAVEALCPEPDTDVVAVLHALVERSLVIADGTHGPVRYRLLETVAVYAGERLEEAGEAEVTRDRHLRHHVAVAEAADRHLRGARQVEWLRRLDREAANHRRALDSAVTLGNTELALRLVDSLAWYWYLRGRLTTLRAACRTALAIVRSDSTVDPGLRLAVEAWHLAAGIVLDEVDDVAGSVTTFLETAERDAPAVAGGPVSSTLSLALLGVGDPALGLMLAARAVDAARTSGDRWQLAFGLVLRAGHARFRGDPDAIGEDAEEAAAHFLELGDRWGQCQCMEALSIRAELRGDLGDARRCAAAALRIATDLDLNLERSLLWSRLGRLALAVADLPRAVAFQDRARRIAREHGYTVAEQHAAFGLALAARRAGRWADAEELLWRSLQWSERQDNANGLAAVHAELGYLAETRGDLDDAVRHHEFALTAARRAGDPRAVAYALEGLAGVAAARGDGVEAARLLGRAIELRGEAERPAGDRGDVERITAAARNAAGAEAFAAAYAHGRSESESEPRTG